MRLLSLASLALISSLSLASLALISSLSLVSLALVSSQVTAKRVVMAPHALGSAHSPRADGRDGNKANGRLPSVYP